MAVSGQTQPFPWVVLVTAGVALAVLLALGTWQVQRLAWKQDLLATIDARIASEPRPLAEVIATARSGGDIDYMPVRASGRFLHDREQFFFATHKGASGWFVYTPLRLADDTGTIFVNRGFIPYDRKDPSTRGEGHVGGVAMVTGLARPRLDAKPSFLVPDNDPEKNVYYWKDLSAMAAKARLDALGPVVPLFIDADDTPNPGGLPVGAVTLISLPNNHLQYAITWYGLALALVAVTTVFVRGRTRRQAGPRT